MENKDSIIIALIVLSIYFFYQQSQKTLPVQPNNQELRELRNQVNHYQTLYQKRVEKDLAGEEKLYQQKINDLEKQLLDLAKQKTKGKKELQELVQQLEKN